MEQLANNAVTYLSADITAIATSVGVVDGSVFPAAGTFTVRIAGEFMKVTSRSGNSLTVVRGEESTVAAIHIKADPVVAVHTRRCLIDYVGDGVVYDLWANKPTVGRRGRLFFQTDGPLMAYDDGTVWNHRVFGCPIVLPNFVTPVWVNQGTSTFDATKGMYRLVGVGSGVHAYVQAAPAAPYSIVIAFTSLTDTGDVGFVYASSTVANLITFGIQSNGLLTGRKWTSATVLSSTYSLPISNGPRPMTWLKFVDDNTNRTISISADGVFWSQILQEVRSTFMTPDRLGIYSNDVGCLNLYSWQ